MEKIQIEYFHRFVKETTPTVVDYHELKWNADLPDPRDHFYQANVAERPLRVQGNLCPILRGEIHWHLQGLATHIRRAG